MIFVTVGSMFPFDRLIRLIDSWSQVHPEADVFAQIGAGAYEPVNMKWTRTLSQVGFAETLRHSSLVIAHAGMGTVIAAGELGKAVVVLPRLKALGEHTTDHQLHTARWLADRPGVFVAMSEDDLNAKIEEALGSTDEYGSIPTTAPPDFIRRIRDFLVS